MNRKIAFTFLFALALMMQLTATVLSAETTNKGKDKAPRLPILIGDCVNLSHKKETVKGAEVKAAIAQELTQSGKDRFRIIPNPADKMESPSLVQWFQNAQELGAESVLQTQIETTPIIADRNVEVAIALSLFDIATGECLNGGYGIAEKKTFTLALQEAVSDAVKQLVQRNQDPAIILKQEGKTLSLNQGLRSGMKVGGDHIVVRSSNRKRERIGKIRIVRSYPYDSEAEILEMNGTIRAGDTILPIIFVYMPELDPRFQITETAAPISEITLESTHCLGIRSVYKVIFRRDGTVLYHGEANVKRVGKYIGSLYLSSFDRLASLAVEMGYSRLKENYSTPISCRYATYTSVVENGQRKSVSHYNDSGPSSLWAFEEMIGLIFREVEDWKKVPKKQEAEFDRNFTAIDE